MCLLQRLKLKSYCQYCARNRKKSRLKRKKFYIIFGHYSSSLRQLSLFLLNIEVSKGFYCTYWLCAFVYLFQLSVKRVCVCVRRTGETKITTKPKPTPSPRAFGFSKWRRKRNLKTEMLLGTRLLRNWAFFDQSSRVHIL